MMPTVATIITGTTERRRGRLGGLSGLAVAAVLAAALVAGLFAGTNAVQAADAGQCDRNDVTTVYLYVGDHCHTASSKEFTGVGSVNYDRYVKVVNDGQSTVQTGPDGSQDAFVGEAVGTAWLELENGTRLTINVIDGDGNLSGRLNDSDGIVGSTGYIEVLIALRALETFGLDQGYIEVVSFNPLLTFWTYDGTDYTYLGQRADLDDHQPLYIDRDGVNSTLSITNGTDFGSQHVAAERTIGGLYLALDHLPDGSYSFLASYVETDSSNPIPRLQGETAEVKFTVGDPGVRLGSVEFGLADGESGTAAAGGSGVKLQLRAFNSLGAAVDSGALTKVTIIATGGRISGSGVTKQANSADLTDRGAETNITIFAPSDTTPATVDVYLIVESTGSPTIVTDPITVNFTGPLASIAVADHLSVPEGETQLFLTGADARGAVVVPDDVDNTFQLKIFDADGTELTGYDAFFDFDLDNAAAGDQPGFAIDWDNDPASDAGLDPGVYTAKVTFDGDAATEATGTITFTGPPADVQLELDTSGGTGLGNVVRAVVTVTDKDGNAVGPTAVNVQATGALVLVGSGDTTTDGVLTRDLVVGSLGIATVTADVTLADGSTVSGLAVFVPGADAPAEAEAAPAPAVPDPGVEGLSSLTAFSTWTSDYVTTASALFAALSGRGVSAVHLWNRAEWIRYSEVDGQLVPGSLDFDVNRSDILHISY